MIRIYIFCVLVFLSLSCHTNICPQLDTQDVLNLSTNKPVIYKNYKFLPYDSQRASDFYKIWLKYYSSTINKSISAEYYNLNPDMFCAYTIMIPKNKNNPISSKLELYLHRKKIKNKKIKKHISQIKVKYKTKKRFGMKTSSQLF